MGQTTGIDWTDSTWNPIRGCSRVSPGCENCYAERTAARFIGPGMAYEGLARRGPQGGRWTGVVRMVPEHLEDPMRWQKPRRIFVNSMSDLFHDELADEAIAAIFGIMAAARRHTFQVLTKRPQRAVQWCTWLDEVAEDHGYARMAYCLRAASEHGAWNGIPYVTEEMRQEIRDDLWPLPNVWLGVTAEDQKRADERIPLLLQCTAAVHFVSYEPALEDVDFTRWLWSYRPGDDAMRDSLPIETWKRRVDWLIAGSESGPGARPADPEWYRHQRDACRAAGVPLFYKQHAIGGVKVKDPKIDGQVYHQFPSVQP